MSIRRCPRDQRRGDRSDLRTRKPWARALPHFAAAAAWSPRIFRRARNSGKTQTRAVVAAFGARFMICGVWRADDGVWPLCGDDRARVRGSGGPRSRVAVRCDLLRPPVRPANNCDRFERPRQIGRCLSLDFRSGWERSFAQAVLMTQLRQQPAVSNRSNIYSITSSARASSGLRPTRTPTAFLNWG